MEISKKGRSLKVIFFEYLVSVTLGLVLALSLAMLSVNFLTSSGMIKPANYAENLILKNKTKLAKSEPFDASLLPSDTSYLLLSNTGKTLKSNMSQATQREARQFHTENFNNTAASSYLEFKRKNGYVIIHYTLQPHYANKWLEKYFPSVNILFATLLVIFCVVTILLITLFWAKRLTKQLAPILEASKKISQQDLDFEMPYSKVSEFNLVINGLEEMKVALSNALASKWRIEEQRKEQVAVLTHDLKTPIAIAQGNAQLLKETKMTSEQQMYVTYILKNSQRIADYAQALMVTNTTADLTKVELIEMQSRAVADKIIEIATEIVATSSLKLHQKIAVEQRSLFIDMKLLERAVQNVLANVLTYAPEDSVLELQLKTTPDQLDLRIVDQGPGFSAADLVHGKERFYRGDKSRHSPKNYGLGLFTVAQIMKLHQGELILENQKNHHGAQVIIKFPLSIADDN